MTSKELRIWQARIGYATQERAYTALGVARRTYQMWLASDKPLPRLVELACWALEQQKQNLQ